MAKKKQANVSNSLARIARDLSREVDKLRFRDPVAYVYNPLDYAWEAHRDYLRRCPAGGSDVVLLGMNPGPFGMAQTGVPFGEVSFVRDWIGVRGKVERPAHEHPKRPILGFDCPRSEVSGARLWGWARDTFGTPKRFFRRFFILNYCPLVFMEDSGRNRTPDKCGKPEREELFGLCDRALRRSIDAIGPTWVIGIGNFAESRAQGVLGDAGPPIGKILHPSPQNPAANRGWAEAATRELEGYGIELE